MGDKLYSVGLDVGTTTTQMVLSQLTVENQASGFSVPKMAITQRQILYRSPVHLTPLQGQSLVDGQRLRQLVLAEYEKAGITPEQVDTGAVIVTGETSRKENAATVLESLSRLAGDFVVATAGPDLESALAAKGAGALALSERTGKRVLHMDIGGGTANLAFIQDGRILQTGCLNVGGRLIRREQDGRISYVSPVLAPLCSLRPGQYPSRQDMTKICQLLTQALEMSAGLRPRTPLLEKLLTQEAQDPWQIPQGPMILSFSGGVADCIEEKYPELAFGDMGPMLGQTIRSSLLCRQEYFLGNETVGATVIGAGCHATQLSGSTVYCSHVSLPMKNLPVISLDHRDQECVQRLARQLSRCDSPNPVLAFPGYEKADYGHVRGLARRICDALGDRPAYICVQQDMAKALGQCISLLLPTRPVLCLDGLRFEKESYLDVGAPVGPCFPVVIKTLVLADPENKERKWNWGL